MHNSTKNIRERERKLSKKIIIWAVFLLLAYYLLTSAYTVKITEAASLNLELYSDKESYEIGEDITLNGTLNLDGTPVTDALVLIQINKADGTLWLVRTLPTGTNATTKKWSLEVVSVTPLPSSSLERGDMLGLCISVHNNDPFDRQTLMVVSLIHETGIPLRVKTIANVTIRANKTETYWFSNVFSIPDDAPDGNATVYVSLITDIPSKGGWAWGLEGQTVITIGSVGGSQQYEVEQIEGGFILKVKTKNVCAQLGNYTVYASVLYVKPPQAYADSASMTFEIILTGDVTGPDGIPDGKVDIRDVAFVAAHFGTQEGDPNWDPKADLTGPENTPDGKVDIRDIALVASHYGEYV